MDAGANLGFLLGGIGVLAVPIFSGVSLEFGASISLPPSSSTA